MNNFLLLILFFVSSCTYLKSKDYSFTETVSLSEGDKDASVNIDENKTIEYGPSFNSKLDNQKTKKMRLPIVALDLVPSLYGSLSYINLFNQLEKKKIKITIINTSSFASIIAILYAKYGNSSRVEWKLFSLLKKLKNEQMFSRKWDREIENFLVKEFGKKRLEEFPILVTIPQGNSPTKLVSSGGVVELILETLRLEKGQSFLNQPNELYKAQVDKLGVDLRFKVSALPTNLKFRNPNGFVYGLYAKLGGYQKTIEDNNLYIIDVSFEFVDTIPNLSDLMMNSHADSERIAEEISQEIQEWISKNN